MTIKLLSDINNNPINLPASNLSTDELNKLPVAIYTCDAQGYITSFNEASVNLWGRTPVIGEDLWCGSWKIVNQDGSYMSLDLCPMARTLKERRMIEGEEIIVERPDGVRRIILAHPVPIFNSEDELTGAVNTLIDITEQKNSEEKHARLAAIIESSDDAIISKNLKGIITSWNRAAEKMFGYTEDEALGKHISLLIPHSRLPEEEVIIDNIRRGNRVDHFETIRIAKSGREIPISLTVSPIRNSKGIVIGASKIARDITLQLDATHKMKLYNKHLEKINSYKDEFIGMASHELKTPLTSVNLYLQMLERSQRDEKNKRFVKQAVSQINKLSSLISDLLDVSKIQSGKLMIRPSLFDVTELINEVVDIMRATTNSHKIIIENETPGAKIINADKHRIEQVLINLITNAIKYSPDAGKVIVRFGSNGMALTVSVIDFGIGIARDQQERIFTRFYRIEELGPSFSGLGIGLYISSEIIRKHGGKLWVDSKPAGGSTFVFEIPHSVDEG